MLFENYPSQGIKPSNSQASTQNSHCRPITGNPFALIRVILGEITFKKGCCGTALYTIPLYFGILNNPLTLKINLINNRTAFLNLNMTMKKRLLFAASGLSALCTLFAFTLPNEVRENVLTLFLPGGARPIAREYAQWDAAQYNKRKLLAAAALRDTNPPLKERFNDFINGGNVNPVDLKDPKAIEKQVEYDPITNRYIVTEKIGEDFYRAPTYMTFDEYLKWRDKKQQQEYFDRLQGVASGDKNSGGAIDPIAKFDIKNSLIDRLFGGTNVDIRPQGNINLTFGYNYQKMENPNLALVQQRNGIFDFDMDINMSASGKIGEKLNLNFNYNTQATFDFDNQMKLNYDTKNFSEDEIIQNVEAGNVSLPLRGNLIQGMQNLFGIKTELKFGHLRTTLVASQQRSRQQNMNVQGGSQIQTFEKPIDEYDENRHFFISHWNRSQFEPSLKCLPVPQSLFKITRAEVWVTNDRGRTENFREVVALADLAEPDSINEANRANFYNAAAPARDIKGQALPDNRNNFLYPRILESINGNTGDSVLRRADKVVRLLNTSFGLKQIRDFEKQRCVMLSPTEYTLNEDLGFVSLNLNVQPDQIVGMALEYTYNGIPYKIGEFTSDVSLGDTLNQNVLFVKMLKSTTANVRYPIWDLMMKNVYSVGANNVDPQEFRFDIFYEDPGKGQKRFLDAADIPTSLRSRPLLQIFNLDMLNLQGDPGPDGIFDFVPGLTINLRSGRVMFPVLEPFGSFLDTAMTRSGATAQTVKKYIYPQLYDSTLFRAREFQELNRFVLRGKYKSSGNGNNNGSEIALNTFNMPPGSVRVTAGGRLLQEGSDYTVDYTTGRVKILNESILQSGQNVNVSFEDNALFSFQNRTMLAARFDYDFSKDVRVGATIMNLFERPLTQKVNFGDDPINNKVYGFDFNISKDAPWMTKFLDKLPLISTKEPSSITAQAEVALLQTGFNKAINQGRKSEGGIAYIDDFEGSTANLRIDWPANQWLLASVPQGDELLFPESRYPDSLVEGANRARLAWYIPEPFVRSGDDLNRPYTRTFNQRDLFPNRDLAPTEQSNIRGFDVTFYPRERGPYNFELPDGYQGVSTGLTERGELKNPETRWGGFMKGLNTQNDFEAANIEFIEFWMLNPYMDQGDGMEVSKDGEMYFDLGSVSEDIMRDSRQFFENAIPTGQGTGSSVNTRWGRVPVIQPVVNAFDNDPAKRGLQDIGLDGLNDDAETNFYGDWLNKIESSTLGNAAIDEIKKDPANDNFVFFGDKDRFDANASLLDKYKYFNGPQGNSPVNDNDRASNSGFLNASNTNIPDQEDLNRDNSLNETEAFFRYKIFLKKRNSNSKGPSELDLDDAALKELVTDTVVVVRDGVEHIWYRFKLPLDLASRQSIGGIQDFRSIRFMRMFWKGFNERTTFRFATLELGRNQWRRYKQDLFAGQCEDRPFNSSVFDINAVTIEENAARTPFNYTIPNGIQRENSVGAFPDVRQNEQSLSLNTCNMQYCQGRAIFRTLNMDLRLYKNLKMFVHAEGKEKDLQEGPTPLKPGVVTSFIRLGSDFVRNYYEYELSMVPSDVGRISSLPTRNSEDARYREEVWRPENEFNIPLQLLVDIKEERNALPNPDYTTPFEKIHRYAVVFEDGTIDTVEARVRVLGNPNLGLVKGAMIGVRNRDTLTKEEHCVELWVNEMRLTGFNNRGGFAGQARVDMKLADVGNVSLAGNYTSSGWRRIDQRLGQTQLEEVKSYDASVNFSVHKLLPEKLGLVIPFYAQRSEVVKTPEYDPYDLDIKLKDKIRAEVDPVKRDSIRDLAEERTVTQGYNFTNVRKERKGGSKRPMPWNVENFSVTYAYNQQRVKTPLILNQTLDQYKGAIDYQYATGLKPFQPFKKLVKKDKYLKFITEFNFNPIPNTYGFSTNVERIRDVTTWRFAGEDPKNNTYYNRRLTWDRNYDLGWDIMKSLRFNFDATMRALVDEPTEYKNDGLGPRVTPEERKQILWDNVKKFGRPKNYTHTASLNYTLPFKVIPMMDWVNVKASYTAGYTWTAQSLKLQNLDAGQYQERTTARNLGNVIQNNSVRQVNGDLDFTKLYDKSKYLAKINKPAPKGGKGAKGNRNSADPGGSGDPSAPGAAAGGKNSKNKRGSGDVTSKDKGKGRDKTSADPTTPTPPTTQPTVDPATGLPSTAGVPGADKSAPNTAGRDASKANTTAPDGLAKANRDDDKKGKKDKDKEKDKEKEKKKERIPTMAERIALRPLMLVRKARFTYSENFGSVVPGFTPEPKFLGQDNGFAAPGWGYIAGLQPSDQWINDAGDKEWITHRPELNQQIMRNWSQNMDAGVTLEPFRDFRVEVSANRQYTKNRTELFKDQTFNLDPDSVGFEHRAQRDIGSFSTSYSALSTLFNKDIDGIFKRFESYGPILSERLGTAAGNLDPHDDQDANSGYVKGYGRIHQEVLIPAFIAAYTEKDPRTTSLDIFSTLPKLNWKLNYNGLSKVGNLDKIFSSVQISHGYKGTMTVNSYNTDIFYNPQQPYTIDELNSNYIARYEIPQVVVNEQFQPLLGVDMKLKNDMSVRVDFKKQRTLQMSFINYQLTETNSTGYTFGFGYRVKNVNIPFLTGKKTKKTSKSKSKKNDKNPAPGGPGAPGGAQQGNDLNFKFDFDYRDDITVNHSLNQLQVAQPTRGARTISINPQVEYTLNKRLKLRLFTDYRKTVPKTSQSFPITTVNGGVTVQFTLN